MKRYLLFFIAILAYSTSTAQTFETALQLRPRYEYRNGFKTLLPEDANPASFISQRSRLIFDYNDTNLEVKFSLQSVGVWGDSPTMRLEDNNAISVFEAYGQYHFSPKFMMRAGRQVLAYDNQRILGEVNWAQQGQSHDAVLMSLLPAGNHRLDVGAAYNANSEVISQVPYSVNSYQNMQFAWYHMDVNNVGFSFLFLNTGYENNNLLPDIKTEYLQTYGGFHRFNSGSFNGDFAAYGQSGKRNGRDVAAWYTGLNLNYKFDAAWSLGLGGEYLSGTDRNNSSGENFSFTPLFGTNHGFNGHMDYFYVGNHHNTVGLLDLYGKISWKSPKTELSVVPHLFSSAAEVGDNYDRRLGTEIDLSGSYKVRKDFTIGVGYSQMFGTETLEILKGGDKDSTQNWAWVMLSFSPKLFQFSLEKI